MFGIVGLLTHFLHQPCRLLIAIDVLVRGSEAAFSYREHSVHLVPDLEGGVSGNIEIIDFCLTWMFNSAKWGFHAGLEQHSRPTTTAFCSSSPTSSHGKNNDFPFNKRQPGIEFSFSGVNCKGEGICFKVELC